MLAAVCLTKEQRSAQFLSPFCSNLTLAMCTFKESLLGETFSGMSALIENVTIYEHQHAPSICMWQWHFTVSGLI